MTIKTHSSFPAQQKSMVLLRMPSDHTEAPEKLKCIEDDVNKGYEVTVFLQGPAAEPSALADWDGVFQRPLWDQVKVSVCQAAWQRNRPTNSVPHWPLMTLVQAWHQLLHADVGHCIGCGDWPSDWPPLINRPSEVAVSGAYGVMINHKPTEQDRVSLVEWLLAGATLDLDLVIAFAGDGLAEWAANSTGCWAQFRDHGLATVIDDPQLADDFSKRQWMVM